MKKKNVCKKLVKKTCKKKKKKKIMQKLSKKNLDQPERCCDGRHNLPDESVEVAVRRPFDVEVFAANVVDRLVIDHEGAVRVLQSGVGGEDGVVGLHH